MIDGQRLKVYSHNARHRNMCVCNVPMMAHDTILYHTSLQTHAYPQSIYTCPLELDDSGTTQLDSIQFSVL